MAESAKEAFKVSNQVSEILRLVSDYNQPLHAVQALSHSVNEIATRSLDKFSMSSKIRKASLTCACLEYRK